MITAQQNKLDTLRLQCEFLLIAGKKCRALEIYDQMLAVNANPLFFTAKAKLLEMLEQPGVAENLQKALQHSGKDDGIRSKEVRFILDLPEQRLLTVNFSVS